MKITVNVTQEDIDAATRLRGSNEWDVVRHCPIAHAGNRLGIGDATVGCNCIGFREGRISGQMPDDAVRFALRFEKRERVQPITFELNLPDLETLPTPAAPTDSGFTPPACLEGYVYTPFSDCAEVEVGHGKVEACEDGVDAVALSGSEGQA